MRRLGKDQQPRAERMTEMTETEVRTIRWVEHVLAPLLVVGFIAIATFLTGVSKTLAQYSVKQDQYEKNAADVKQTVDDIKATQTTIIQSQHEIEVDVQRLDTNQEHIKDDLTELKEQNTEILKILRSR